MRPEEILCRFRIDALERKVGAMRKTKLLTVLLVGALAACAAALAGCGNDAEKVKAAFETDPVVTEFDVDSDFVEDTPFAVTAFEVVRDGNANGIPSVDFEATLENESFKVQMTGGALKGENDAYIFNVYDTTVSAKKGIDFLVEDGVRLADDPGYTVSFDEASQSCIVTADKAEADDRGYGIKSVTGKAELIFDEDRWQSAGPDSIRATTEWNVDAIEGTYVLDDKKPGVPETVIVSNVKADPEDGNAATFVVEYSFDGVEVKNEGTLEASADWVYVEAKGEYPAVNDDVDYIAAALSAHLVFTGDKMLMEDVHISSKELRSNVAVTLRVGSEDPLTAEVSQLVYVKQ